MPRGPRGEKRRGITATCISALKASCSRPPPGCTMGRTIPYRASTRQNGIIRGWRPSLAQNAQLSRMKQLPDGDLTNQLNVPMCEAPNGGRRAS